MGQPLSRCENESNMAHSMELPSVRVKLRPLSRHGDYDRSFTLSKSNSFMIVGRASSTSHRITSAREHNCYVNSPIMSRIHAKFSLGDEEHPLKIVDEGSTHGTYLNNTKLQSGESNPVGEGSVVTFGGVVQHGDTTYQPSKYRVDYKWNADPWKSTGSSSEAPVVIRCPSLPSDSEVDELYEALDDYQAPPSPSAIHIGSPVFVDLTQDHESTTSNESRLKPTNSGEPDILDQENDNRETEFLRQLDDPEELSYVGETNLDTTRSSYRLDYPDSDFEEEEDTTSYSSPPRAETVSVHEAMSVSSILDTSEALAIIPRVSETVSHMPLQSRMLDGEETLDAAMDLSSVSQSKSGQRLADELKDNFKALQDEIDQENADEDFSAEEETSSLAEDDLTAPYAEALWFFRALKRDSDRSIIDRFEAMRPGGLKCMVQAKEFLETIAEVRSADEIWDFLAILDAEQEELERDDQSEIEELFTDSEIDEDIYIEDFEEDIVLDDHNDSNAIDGALEYETEENVRNAATSVSTQNSPSQKHHPMVPGSSHGNANLVQELDHQTACHNHSQPLVGAQSLGLPAQHNHSSRNATSSSRMQISSILDSVPTNQTVAETKPDLLASDDSITITTLPPVTTFPGFDDPVLDTITCTGNAASTMERLGDYTCSNRKRKVDQAGLEEKSEEIGPDDAFDMASPTYASNVVSLSNSNSKGHGSMDTEVNPVSHTAQDGSLDIAHSRNHGSPPSKKVKVERQSSRLSGRFRSFATHCLAGTVGAIGVIAAIVATTPLQLQEEVFYQTL